MKILSYDKQSDGIILETSKGRIKLQWSKDDILHVMYSREKEFSKKESLMLSQKVQEKVDWKLREDESSIIFSTNSIQLVINKETAAFSYFDYKGNLIAKEPDKGGKTLTEVDVEKTVFDDDSSIKMVDSVDGVRAKVENAKKILDRKAYHTKLEFEWDENEAIYGLGSHEEGIMNYRGHAQYLYQQNMKIAIPMFVSTKGYGILVDSYSFMTFHDDVYGSYIWTDVDDEMDYYFIYGPEFDNVVKGYRYLTGKASMLPRWAFGYVQSKERYKSQQELIEVVKEYRERKIPLDLIVLDWCSWTGELWGQKSFDPERFPSPENMMEEIHDMNAKLMISIWPIMRNDGPNHVEMRQHGFLLGNEANYDAFNKEARALYWKQANEGLFSKGIDAWWCDCTEPFESDWHGEEKPEPEERLKINVDEFKKYLDPEYISAFSLQHSKGIYEGQRNVTDKKRVVNLTRSSYAGQQRYGTITWSGDISASWQTLKKQIPEGLNYCAAGMPYWTLDIGGFFASSKDNLWFWNGNYDEGIQDEGYKELYLRWFQYGAFLPMFRSHGTDTPREVWRFGEPGTIIYDTLVKFDYLRYRLIPYIYSLAWKITNNDYTLMKPLGLDFSDDVKTHNIDDQYMFGTAFLVNPVTKPMYYEAGSKKLENTQKTRKVYLPEGTDWYDFWTGELFNGGQDIDARADMNIMPLYVKAGSIVPMGPKIQHTSEALAAPLEIRIYSGADSEFTLYEDEGDNYNYEKGKYTEIKFKWSDADKKLDIGERIGSFEGMVNEREFNIILVNQGRGTGVEVSKEYDGKILYNGFKTAISLYE